MDHLKTQLSIQQEEIQMLRTLVSTSTIHEKNDILSDMTSTSWEKEGEKYEQKKSQKKMNMI